MPTFSELLERARQSGEHLDEWAISDFTEELTRRMEELGLSRSALAAKIGVSQPYITKVLRGDANFTIRSMAKLAWAVDSMIRVHLAPVGAVTIWKDEINGSLADAVMNQSTDVRFPGGRMSARHVEVSTVASGASVRL